MCSVHFNNSINSFVQCSVDLEDPETESALVGLWMTNQWNISILQQNLISFHLPVECFALRQRLVHDSSGFMQSASGLRAETSRSVLILICHRRNNPAASSAWAKKRPDYTSTGCENTDDVGCAVWQEATSHRKEEKSENQENQYYWLVFHSIRKQRKECI